MFAYQVKKILLKNQFSGKSPNNMTQLAAALGISYKHLRDLIRLARTQDIDRIARGLGVDINVLLSKDSPEIIQIQSK